MQKGLIAFLALVLGISYGCAALKPGPSEGTDAKLKTVINTFVPGLKTKDDIVKELGKPVYHLKMPNNGELLGYEGHSNLTFFFAITDNVYRMVQAFRSEDVKARKRFLADDLLKVYPCFQVKTTVREPARSDKTGFTQGTVSSSSPGGLIWDPPTTRQNGEPLTDLAGFRIYYRAIPERDFKLLMQVDDPGARSCRLPNIKPGSYYFVVTAFDRSGRESSYSNQFPEGPPLRISP